MNIYKIAFRNEWDILANKVSEEISLFVKNNYSHFKEGIEEIRVVSSNGINIKLHTVIINEARESILSVKGGVNRNTLDLHVFAKFNKKHFILKNHLDLLWRKTHKAIRHEIDHIQYLGKLKEQGQPFVQGYNPNKLNSLDLIEQFNERVKYLSQEYERTAFLKSLKMDAVKNKISAINSIKEFIHEQLFTISLEQEAKIRQQVGSRATQMEQFFVKQYINALLVIYPKILNSKFISDSEKGDLK